MRQTTPILLFSLAAVFGALGQWLYKQGAERLNAHGLNGMILGGVAAFTAVMVLFVLAYRLGGRISVVYPFYATTFIWGALMGIWIDHEPWSWLQVIGIGVMLVGVALVAQGT